MRRVLLPPNEAVIEPRLIGGRSTATEWGRLLLGVVVLAWLSAPVVGFLNVLTLLTAVGFAAALLGFSRPALGLLGVTMVCTLDPLVRAMLSNALLRWNTFNYCLLLVMAVSSSFVWRVADLHSRLLKVFILLLAADLVLSPEYEMGVQHILNVATLFGLLVYAAQAGGDEDIWYMVGVVNGTVGALGGLMYLLLKEGLPAVNPNAWSLFPEAAVFSACLGFRHAATRKNGQLVLGLLAGANVMWTFLSASRGGLLIASVGLIYILMSMKRGTHRLVVVSGAVALVVVSFAVFAAQGDRTLYRFNKLFDEEQSVAGRTSGRSDLAVAGLHMFKEHPFGVGTGGFAHAWSQVGFLPGLSTFKRGEEFQAHSGWIKVLAENGVPGILLMMAYVGSFAYCGITGRREGKLPLGLLTTCALAMAFVSTEFQGKTFWMLAAGATAQLHPREMARCLAAETERFWGRPRRLLTDPPNRDQPLSPSSTS